MSDRELLELAAKAAGIQIDKTKTNGGGAANTGFDLLGNAVLNWHNGVTWNPLTDDGDALRLAVKLRMSVYVTFDEASARALRQYIEPFGIPGEPQSDLAATRRAIVRAAAEIGKQMGEQS